MSLPTTGPISLGQVNTELKRPATQTISLNDGQVRQLAGRPSGTISMSDLHGKSAAIWVKVGNTYGIGIIADGNPISEAISKAISQCSSSISSKYGVSIRPEFTVGATVYSSNKLAKTITTKAITDNNSISARIEVDVYKFQ